MKKLISAALSAAVTLSATAVCVPYNTSAENPIIQTSFTPDPAPVIYGDELWVYTGRDRDGDNDFYYMTGWQAFSTKDMKNWTNHGCFLEDDEYSWCNANDAWASQCIERNGKYYFYFTTTAKTGGGRAIGVGVADNTAGPFKDVLGKPLAGPNWDYIDPTVIIDDDGQAWLMFGNPKCYYVKLKEDMVTLDGQIKSFDMTEQAFGTGKNGSAYGEGPWIYKHNNMYYLVYAGFYGSDGGESMCYSYGPTVTGPWTFGGQITGQSNCFTTHGGIIDYKDHSYMFYHMNGLKGGGTFNRSAAVEEFTYNSDGTIPKIKTGTNGPDQIESLNPFERTEAETMCWESGIGTEKCSEGGLDVCNIEKGDYVKVAGVDFGNGAESFTASVASDTDGGTLELHIDDVKGPVIGALEIKGTGGWQKWEEVSCDVSVDGEHDLYLVFNGGSGYLYNVDWWKFSGAGSNTVPAEPDPDGYIVHNTFSKGTEGWTGRGDASVAVSSVKFGDMKSLKVTDRNSSWNGAIKKLSSDIKPGGTYSFSINAMTDQSSAAETFYFTLQYNDADDETHYDKIAIVKAANGKWVQLANTAYTIPADAVDPQIYVETESGKNDFYIADAVIAERGTVISGAEGGQIIPGDVNFDGAVDALDIALARKCLVKGFSDDMQILAADVDSSEKYEINDLVLIQDYVLGKISEFPDNSPEPVIEETPASNFSYNPALSYKEAPGNYLNPCEKAGKVIKESYSGINGQNSLNVYLPYGYDENKQYNIFYLMHGGGENENTIFSNDVKLNNILDHMIMNGELEPLIVVTPTFNKCAADKFYDEFRKSVVPFVEGKYSTYAKSTSDADIKASRMHRAYGGFSMGGLSTWCVADHDMDIVGYFMPLSGNNWEGMNALTKEIDSLGLKKNEYFIFAATGDEDIAYNNMLPEMNDLKTRSQFTYTSDFSKGNLYWLVAPGKTHWWGYVRHYVYDALPYFFHEGQ